MLESYPDFFAKVTEKLPLPFQERYAANAFSQNLLLIPTGLGKTHTVLLPWLYAHSGSRRDVPSRLVFVLPRQNLTAQTAAEARKLVERAQLPQIRVLELMASSKDNRENLSPHQPAIIVATQDLYFSRALNRGYARRPPRWPIDFALYNQDCLIVLDEIQLMDEALATSTQLAAFRETFKTFGNTPSVWMSATVNTSWLQTIDSPGPPPVIQLDERDLETPLVIKRYHAPKTLAQAPLACRTPVGCAEFALKNHRPGTRTLVIANTVLRAREIFSVIRKSFAGVVLIHSRFRPVDRKQAYQKLVALPERGQIVVSTQVLEAGVDITSRLLITDIAPWGSLVQRFGRVNRYGDDEDANIFWVDQPEYAKQKDLFAPYTQEQIHHAAARVHNLASAAPADLPAEDSPATYQHVLRRADLLDLFDTTPDLAGNELDVSRFIRAGDEKDVYLAWREWSGDPPTQFDELEDSELCPVPIGEIRNFIRKHFVYCLNFSTDQWMLVTQDTPLFPGMLLLTKCAEGGYAPLEGWSPESTANVPPVAVETHAAETDSTDLPSFPQYRQTLAAHTERVCRKLEDILGVSQLPEPCAAALRLAARKHDWGKAHEVFQNTMHRRDSSPDLLAKQCGHAKHRVPHFRHELASALAMLQSGDSDLAAYLAAAHHGRVRLGIRSMPGERQESSARPVARGVVEGDILHAFSIFPGVDLPEVTLSLDVMQFGAGNGSWTSRMLALLNEYGPFRLAYLEMLLRSADEEASRDHGPEATDCPS